MNNSTKFLAFSVPILPLTILFISCYRYYRSQILTAIIGFLLGVEIGIVVCGSLLLILK